MLLRYRTGKHSVTDESLCLFLFFREINNNLPTVVKFKHSSDKAVRQNQHQVYSKAKKHFDKNRKAVDHDINVNDYVLLKREKRTDKMKAKFYKNIFKVVSVNHNSITIQSELGNKYFSLIWPNQSVQKQKIY